HDSLKAEKNLRYVLPKVLEYLKEKNLSPVAFDSCS
ncbi:MAG TPA: polysaccharide deacetylase family protein, partial [Aequorivita sp.]|nr:polysaccharide deacetylase family protein [Aequorivita sp.]